MATGVEELLDMLFEMIDEAKSMPLSSDKCILERDKALDLLDEIRAQFPMELAEAKKLIAARTEYIASAKREAEAIRRQAEEKAKQLLRNSDFTVSEIAQRTGFCDASYLTRLFRRHEKMTPRRYAERGREWETPPRCPPGAEEEPNS